MLKIPYGESNFRTLIEEGYFYQDRTMYIRELEDKATKYVFYLRPRRFGKRHFERRWCTSKTTFSDPK